MGRIVAERDEKGHVIDLAPFMKKYIDLPGDSNPSSSNHDGSYIEVPDDSIDTQATIVTRNLPNDLNDEKIKGDYDSPIPLDLGQIDEGQKKIVDLDVNGKVGNPKLVELDVTNKTGNPKVVRLDGVIDKRGDKVLVELDVNGNKTPDPKVVKLDNVATETPPEPSVVPLNEASSNLTTNIINSLNKKVITLNVSGSNNSYDRLVKLSEYDQGSGSDSKIVRLENVENRDLSDKKTLVLLQLTSQKTGEVKLVKLDVDKKTGEAKLVGLDIPDTEGRTKLVNLTLDEKSGTTKLVPLEVEVKDGNQVLVPLNVEDKEGRTELVKLEVEEKTGEQVLVPLEVDPKDGEPKLVELNVPEKIGEVKLVRLEVSELIGEAVLVKLIVEPKTKDPVLVELTVPELTKDPVIVPLNVPTLTKDPVLVLLQVNPKTKDPVLVKLDVPEITGNIKIVELQVDPKTKEPVLVPLYVPEKTGEAKLVELEVEEKTKDPVLIELDVPEKTGEQVLVPLEVDPKTGNPKLVGLDVPNITGEAKLVELNVEEKEGDEVIVPLSENENDEIDSNISEYDGESYFPGTTIPVHQSSPNSLVDSSASKITELDPEARKKYEATAAWLGIPGVAGINAAMDYENLMDLYDRMGTIGERLKSYLTASLAGSGEISPMVSHTLAAAYANPVIRLANYGIRELNETQLMDSIASVTEVVGVTKDKMIQKLLKEAVAGYNLGLVALGTDPNRMPGAANSISSTIAGAVSDIGSGTSIIDTAKNAINNILAKEDPLNVPKWDGAAVSDRFSTANYAKHVKDPDVYTNKISKIGPGGSTSMNFDDRMESKGMETTITELISASKEEVWSLTELRNILNTRGSSIITNYKNHLLGGKKDKGIGDVGLDTNNVWEITLYPLIDDTMNGGSTYLPPIGYINQHNEDWFGIKTGYTRWLPFTSFELQDKKMTSRALNLYDGSITYPISIEFVNELRITLADDQLKSFRNYFDTVLKVSAYQSKEYVSSTDISDPEIDETKPMVAMYKNLTFECNIYVMNLEMATVKKFPLLVVLRDYIREFNGDIEPSSVDLSLQFSIVGELDDSGSTTLSRLEFERQAVMDQFNNSSYRLEEPEGPSPAARVIDSIFN